MKLYLVDCWKEGDYSSIRYTAAIAARTTDEAIQLAQREGHGMLGENAIEVDMERIGRLRKPREIDPLYFK